mgnify:CR=1 FL=1
MKLPFSKNKTNGSPKIISEKVLTAEELMAMQAYVEQIYVDDRVYDYVARIAKATRNSPEILQGISPRGSIAVLAIAKAEAFLRGHTYVLPSDIQYVLMDAAAHRIIVDNGLRNGNVTAETALKMCLKRFRAETGCEKGRLNEKKEDFCISSVCWGYSG